MPNPGDRWESYVELNGLTNPTDVIAALNAAWSSYKTAVGKYPNVWELVGTKMFYGGY